MYDVKADVYESMMYDVYVYESMMCSCGSFVRALR